jgi:hypothetical protein
VRNCIVAHSAGAPAIDGSVVNIDCSDFPRCWLRFIRRLAASANRDRAVECSDDDDLAN